jgi:ferritin-like metal-binding protein YciE
MKSMNSLDDLFLDQIKDMYNAENQLIKALPKLAKDVDNDELRDAILSHLEETKMQAERLEQIFEILGKPAKGQKCEAMTGLIEETKETVGHDGDPAVIDAAAICCAQKVEHYEIATYGTLISWAKLLGHDEAAALLEESIAEEKAADEKLTDIAENIINQAAEDAESDEDEDEEEEEDEDEEEDEEMETAEETSGSRRGRSRR